MSLSFTFTRSSDRLKFTTLCERIEHSTARKDYNQDASMRRTIYWFTYKTDLLGKRSWICPLQRPYERQWKDFTPPFYVLNTYMLLPPEVNPCSSVYCPSLTVIKNVIIAVISRYKFCMKINRFFLTGMEAKINGDDQVFIYVNGRFIGVDNGKWKIPTRYNWRLLCVYVSYKQARMWINPIKNKSSILFTIKFQIKSCMHVCKYACREMQWWARRLRVDGLHAKPPLVVEILST